MRRGRGLQLLESPEPLPNGGALPRKQAPKGGGHIDWSRYRIDTSHARGRRVCEALHWAAVNYPYAFADPRVLAKIVLVMGRLPAFDSQEIKMIRQSLFSANALLLRHYNREIVTEPGVGLRASVDDLDKTEHVLTRRRTRVESSVRSFKHTAQSIDPAKIPNTPAARPMKEFAMRATKELLPLLNSDLWQKRLLPPADPNEGKR